MFGCVSAKVSGEFLLESAVGRRKETGLTVYQCVEDVESVTCGEVGRDHLLPVVL